METWTDALKQEFYQALLDKNPDYENVFYVGVKTTGVFCRPTCPARKPLLHNCEFFKTAQEALFATFRPCQRCKPLSYPNQVSTLVKRLVEAVESHPEKRWRTADFKALGVDDSTARRQFKKRFGMTFVEYARARRLGLALKEVRKGTPVIEAQLNAGYESSSGFRDAFSRIMGASPTRLDASHKVLKVSWLDSPLGPMVAIADDELLYLLEFVDRRALELEIKRLRTKTRSVIVPGSSAPLTSIQNELKAYFSGTLQKFSTPLYLMGSPFQQHAWKRLMHIPYGETRSYVEQAIAMGKPSACRAVANANGANQLAIIIPCHRIINHNGELGGYGGGLARKQWLIQHEKAHKT